MKKLFTCTVSSLGIAALGVLAWSLMRAAAISDEEAEAIYRNPVGF